MTEPQSYADGRIVVRNPFNAGFGGWDVSIAPDGKVTIMPPPPPLNVEVVRADETLTRSVPFDGQLLDRLRLAQSTLGVPLDHDIKIGYGTLAQLFAGGRLTDAHLAASPPRRTVGNMWFLEIPAQGNDPELQLYFCDEWEGYLVELP